MISLIYSPFPTLKSAKSTGRLIVKLGLAACVNILHSNSIYEWNGKISSANEYILIAKTSLKKEKAVIKAIKENHPYALPAILSWKVKSNDEYKEWVLNQLAMEYRKGV